jgi:hypothetical protein
VNQICRIGLSGEAALAGLETGVLHRLHAPLDLFVFDLALDIP